MRPVLLALALASSLACSDEPAPSPGPDSEHDTALPPGLGVERDAAAKASARVEAFLVAPNWPALTELLATPHGLARELLGPHRLQYRARLSTGPAGLDPDQPLPRVRVDQPIYERFSLTDELELRWGASAGEPPRLFLDQHNEHEHGRALIVIGEQVWSKLDERGWLARPLETDLWQLWADDAQHAALDLIELAGPEADIDAIETIEHDARPAVRVSLRASERPHPERIVDAPTPWRHDARVELDEAIVIIDRATGLWLDARITLRWSFEDSASRELAGAAEFEGHVEVLAEPPTIMAPAGAIGVPERDRPELLRERMLDGLAGP